MSRDLEVARTVQARLLPQTQPTLRTLEYAAQYLPAGAVSGDYYDFLPISEHEVGFVVADVSGKGVSAAILMATLQSFFRSRVPESFRDLDGLLRSLNDQFLRSSPAEQYATVFFGVYSDLSRTLRYVNCGHMPPMLARLSGECERLDSTATVLGLFEEWDCSTEECRLNPGDTLLMFSDGVTEAMDGSDEEFGDEQVMRLLCASASIPLKASVDQVFRAIHEHSGGQMADDLTLVGLRARATTSFD